MQSIATSQGLGAGLSRANAIRRWATEGARAYTSIQGESVHISNRPNTVLDSGCWFGVNKRCAGYTSEAAMAILENQISKPGEHSRYIQMGIKARKSVVLTILEYYRKRFNVIDMIRACEVLTTLGCADDTFYWGYNNSWTPRKILQGLKPNDDTVHRWLAKNIHIQFAGGPPDNWNIFDGTLLSMMLDRVAVVVLLEGSSALKNLHGIWEAYP